MKYILTQTFKEGDRICHVKNWYYGPNNFPKPIWFTATNSDVEEYSGKNGWYVMEIKEETKPLYTEEEVKKLCGRSWHRSKRIATGDIEVSLEETNDFMDWWTKSKKYK